VRGKRYSLSDIAVNWKKDSRMWLWKSKSLSQRKRSLGELREQLKSMKLD
jgi:hypothetical protein